jgi:hypothetical protein
MRQHGTPYYMVVRFFALRAKNEQQSAGKAPLPVITQLSI